MCTFQRVADALDRLAQEKVCPRYKACTYKKKSDACLKDRGGDCYRWFVYASRHVDEGRA